MDRRNCSNLATRALLTVLCPLFVFVAACKGEVGGGFDGKRGVSVGNKPPSSAPASPPAASAVCTQGKDQTCNDNPEISSLHGICNPNGTCTCHKGFARNPATGRCRTP